MIKQYNDTCKHWRTRKKTYFRNRCSKTWTDGMQSQTFRDSYGLISWLRKLQDNHTRFILIQVPIEILMKIDPGDLKVQ